MEKKQEGSGVSRKNFTTLLCLFLFFASLLQLFCSSALAGSDIPDTYQLVTGEPILDSLVNPNLDIVEKSPGNINASNYSDINAAAAGCTGGKTLVVSAPFILAGTLTFASDCSLVVIKGGSIAKTSAYTLAINGPFSAGLYQVFSGFSAGDVTFGTGAVKEVYPQWWYSGSGSYSTAVSSALASHKRIAFVGNGVSYTLSEKVSLPNAHREIVGYGWPIITTASGNTIFEQTNHQKYTVFDGLWFEGNGEAIYFNAVDEDSSMTELVIRNCVFGVSDSKYAVKLVGPRGYLIEGSTFFGTSGGNGIYASHTGFGWIRATRFHGADHTGTAAFWDGLGSGYSTGPYFENVEIMGWEYGVIVSRCDDMKISGSTIDYNKNSIRLLGQDSGRITGNWLGGPNQGYGNTPVIYMATDTDQTSSINIEGNDIRGIGAHGGSGNLHDLIQMSNTMQVKISNNHITFWTRYGIDYSGDTNLHVVDNHFAYTPSTGGTAAIHIGTDDGSNKIILNQFANPDATIVGAGSVYAQLFQNRNYVTENSGTATIPAGKTSVVVNHKLSFTPSDGEIMVIPVSPLGETTKFWVGGYSGTQFTITVNSDPGKEGARFAWQARKRSY